MEEPEDEADEELKAPAEDDELPPFDEAELNDEEFPAFDETPRTARWSHVRCKIHGSNPFSARDRASAAADYLLSRRREHRGELVMRPLGGADPFETRKQQTLRKKNEKQRRRNTADLSHEAYLAAGGIRRGEGPGGEKGVSEYVRCHND